MNEAAFSIHTDGGARGNPGPAACAFVAEENSVVVYKASKFLGRETNNLAEYHGVILALEWINKDPGTFSGKGIIFFLDSELVVRQLKGIYKIKNPKLLDLHLKARKLIDNSGAKIDFVHVPRNKNKLADFLVNSELDKSA